MSEQFELLKSWGFPHKVCKDKLHLKRLPELELVKWQRYMLIYGDYRTGKTSLVANNIYWRYNHDRPDRPMFGHRFDTAQFTEILCLADKIGLARACDQQTGGEASGEKLQNLLESILEDKELLILDDFNLDSLSNDLQIKKVSQVVLNRYMTGKPVWLITNETPETLGEAFPRLMSRVDAEDDWTMLEKGPLDHILEDAEL